MQGQKVSAKIIKNELALHANDAYAETAQRFFKTGKGEYGEGDIFIGVRVPNIRKVAKKYKDAPLPVIEKLVQSKIHEERMLGLITLVYKYKNGDVYLQEQIYKMYMANLKYVNNWDLVDVTVPDIVGAYLYTRTRSVAKKTLQKLALSKNMWERRVAILATYFFIRQGRLGETLGIAQMLRKDEHDLIHKAVGWMLREVGNRNREVEERFLKKYYKQMPRTMLRYAIEKFPESLRKAYLHGTV